MLDLSDRNANPGFIDAHVHFTMDATNLARQTLDSSAAKAPKGLSLAREYMNCGFTTLRDLGCGDPDWPPIDFAVEQSAIRLNRLNRRVATAVTPLSVKTSVPSRSTESRK